MVIDKQSPIKLLLILTAFLSAVVGIHLTNIGHIMVAAAIPITWVLLWPSGILHPLNILTGFYFLYVTVPVIIETWMTQTGYSLELDWVQVMRWNLISEGTLEFTTYVFFIQVAFIQLFIGKESPQFAHNLTHTTHFRYSWIVTLFGFNLLLTLIFIHLSGGLDLWINDYSNTYLSKRAGLGGINYILITLGNVAVYCLGVAVKRRKYVALSVLLAVFIIFEQSFVGGFKGRFIILLLLFFAPWLVSARTKSLYVSTFVVLFFLILYATTLWRTDGFYASGFRFLEMMIGYFNAIPLHDSTISGTDPRMFSTAWMFLVKPMQVLGLLDRDVSFDISVELTKRYFPSNWAELATQQWPLLTDLHLNFYGVWFSWVPLLIYCGWIGFLYKKVAFGKDLALLPISILEFIRFFSTQRGTLIPWDLPVIVVQYTVLYILTRHILTISRYSYRNKRIGKFAE